MKKEKGKKQPLITLIFDMKITSNIKKSA